ncbi:transcriptional regulator with XRE-family HTH domain [Saccharomonospora amisosensis]|uniref:Transcriptional regulator with XRE-family HTH domain n=1 Tax=Saccharomonospora amisosensis TaxID=1128677 RepID=A0A7X5ZSZ0_9PSEU|nr:helix-turn-helix transcriptional regulator [Saccharomonospora amisosensis]NIJ14412.1 transcriptional regulator with XRE-family HTH domain [Saccharomonospora amisosensis]
MTENALGRFLRARREAVTPADVGLPAGPRRRTPGLRRGELAVLAGISVEYLTRLERGSDRRPSAQVLGALADVLGLAPEERGHLHRLVKAGAGGACAFAVPPARTVRPTVRVLLDRLEPTPAFVADAQGDVLACTKGFRRLAAPAGLFDADPPNFARFVFTDPRARTTFPEWERVADRHAAALRAAADLGHHGAAVLAEELSITVGREFGRRFTAAAALPAGTGDERWAHPEAGGLHLAYECLVLSGGDEHRLTAYLPADTATTVALDALVAVRAAG